MEKMSCVVFALYKPSADQEEELQTLLEGHVSLLRECGLATSRPPILLESSNGTFIEIFEWISETAAEQAHQHPRIAALWEKMGKVAEFATLESLDESNRTFAHFQPMN